MRLPRTPTGEDLIVIDGSYGEGGGQILRTSLSLAALCGRPTELVHIRAGREKPGLAPQHLMCAQAVRAISAGTLDGAELRSQRLRITPGRVEPGSYAFDIGENQPSAGATSLLFQTLLPALLLADDRSELRLVGGTHVPWSPPFPYLEHVFLPALRAMGAPVGASMPAAGWYPRGQGQVAFSVVPATALSPLEWTDRGRIIRARCISAVSNLPDHIAQRQYSAAAGALREIGVPVEKEVLSLPSVGQGTACFVALEFERGLAGFTSLGRRGKPAEKVGQEAAAEALSFLRGTACVDKHLGDQLVLYLALAEGQSKLAVEEVTLHLTTNVWAVRNYLDVRIDVQGDMGQPGVVTVG